jgi:hypothetical protein
MTAERPEPDPVTDVTGSFVGPSRARTRTRDADTEGMRHIRHASSQEVHHA